MTNLAATKLGRRKVFANSRDSLLRCNSSCACDALSCRCAKRLRVRSHHLLSAAHIQRERESRSMCISPPQCAKKIWNHTRSNLLLVALCEHSACMCFLLNCNKYFLLCAAAAACSLKRGREETHARDETRPWESRNSHTQELCEQPLAKIALSKRMHTFRSLSQPDYAACVCAYLIIINRLCVAWSDSRHYY